jgi:transcriptional regulator with XRE-family HTH domain
MSTKRKEMPWNYGPLRDWDICGMNHYHLNGDPRRRLFVSMVKNDRCIKAEGPDEAKVFSELEKEAAGVSSLPEIKHAENQTGAALRLQKPESSRLMAVGERIKLFRILLGLTQVDLGRTLSKPQRNISSIERGKFLPGAMAVRNFCESFGVCADYLKTGSGSPFFEPLRVFCLPPESFKHYCEYNRRAFTTKSNDLLDTLLSLFGSFLLETAAEEYHVARCEPGKAIYAFRMGTGHYFALKTSIEWIKGLNRVIETSALGLVRTQEVAIGCEIYDTFNNQSTIEVIEELFGINHSNTD